MRRGALLPAVLVAALALAAPARPRRPTSSSTRSYGGGGNAGATLSNDFIELFNRGHAGRPEQLVGPVQLPPAPRRQHHPGTIQPGDHFVVCVPGRRRDGDLPRTADGSSGMGGHRRARRGRRTATPLGLHTPSLPRPPACATSSARGATADFEAAARRPPRTRPRCSATRPAADTDNNAADFASPTRRRASQNDRRLPAPGDPAPSVTPTARRRSHRRRRRPNSR